MQTAWYHGFKLEVPTHEYAMELIWLLANPHVQTALLHMPLWLHLFKAVWFSASHLTLLNERIFKDHDDLKHSFGLSTKNLEEYLLHRMNTVLAHQAE